MNAAQIDQLWNFNDPAASEERFRQLLADLPAGSPAALEVQTQIARTFSLRRQFDQAHALLDAIQPQLPVGNDHLTVRYWLERGRTHNSAGEKATARELFLQAWELVHANANEAVYAIDAAHMLGIVEPPDQQMAWNRKALAIAEASHDENARNWRGSLYNNIGWSYHDRGDFQSALDYFRKGVSERERSGQPAELRIAKWTVGRALRSLGRIDEALAAQRALLAEFEQIDARDGYVFEEIAECLLLQDQRPAAARFFALAHAELSQDSYLVQHEAVRLQRLRDLGEEKA